MGTSQEKSTLPTVNMENLLSSLKSALEEKDGSSIKYEEFKSLVTPFIQGDQFEKLRTIPRDVFSDVKNLYENWGPENGVTSKDVDVLAERITLLIDSNTFQERKGSALDMAKELSGYLREVYGHLSQEKKSFTPENFSNYLCELQGELEREPDNQHLKKRYQLLNYFSHATYNDGKGINNILTCFDKISGMFGTTIVTQLTPKHFDALDSALDDLGKHPLVPLDETKPREVAYYLCKALFNCQKAFERGRSGSYTDD